MFGGTKTLAFFIMVLGKTLEVHLDILKKQTKRLKLQEVSLVDKSDVVLAFVPIVSRAGTDIAAALEKILLKRTNRPVVLIVMHTTYEVDYIVPDSKRVVEQFNNVLAVDILYNEETGLLQCSKNNTSLKEITDYLICLRDSASGTLAHSPKCDFFGWAFGIVLSALSIFVILTVLYYYTDLFH